MIEKIGLGYDIHRLVKNRKLVLGGVTIPYAKGLEGHSDADVVLHAVCDALLGALGLGDIGEHFPNTDGRYRGISSVILLEKVFALVQRKGLAVHNVDTVVIAEKPNLKLYKDQMRRVIAQALKVSPASVNIKATTREGMGLNGKQEAIAAYAVALLKEKKR